MTRWQLAFALLVEESRAPARDSYLDLGRRQLAEGSVAEAVFSLDTAVRRLTERAGEAKQFAEAYAVLGAAYVGRDTMERKRTGCPR